MGGMLHREAAGRQERRPRAEFSLRNQAWLSVCKSAPARLSASANRGRLRAAPPRPRRASGAAVRAGGADWNSGRSSIRASGLWPSRPSSSALSTSSARAITRRRQPGELGDMDAIGAIGRARRHLVQEDDGIVPFADAHGHAGERCEPFGQRRHLVIMRGEQRARLVGLVQMFGRRPGDRETIEGRGAAADLVEDDEALFRRLIEDGGGLHHLDHEGRTAARQIVGGADAAEQLVDNADMGGRPPARRRPSAPGSRSARSGAERSTCRPCWGRSPATAGRCRRATDRNHWARRARRLRLRAPLRRRDDGRA